MAEAASVDLIMVIDTSISMAAATTGDPNIIDPGDDPTACNPTNTCEPMADVKAEAQAFADRLYYPYDRVAVVALTSQTAGGSRDPVMVWPLQSSGDGPTDQANVDAAISGLNVFQPPDCPQPVSPNPSPMAGPCLNYPAPSYTFAGQECEIYRNTSPADATTCNSTNGGGGLLLAGSEFVQAPGGSEKIPFGLWWRCSAVPQTRVCLGRATRDIQMGIVHQSIGQLVIHFVFSQQWIGLPRVIQPAITKATQTILRWITRAIWQIM